MLPTPLAWLPSFAHSLSGALDCSVNFTVDKTVNPLVFKVRVQFGEALTGTQLMLFWNLFQKYAAKNDSVPEGKTSGWGKEMVMLVGVKRRSGPARDEHPLG